MHINDILDKCDLIYLAIRGHIQHDLPLLIALTECWDQDYCIFHLSIGEMIMILLNYTISRVSPSGVI